ncbi:hypothetical protein G6F31_013564 [Rhizopus arrhizus]|nr:hypothetical protein G6F31_013564 [Rhizopus arrhizus]
MMSLPAPPLMTSLPTTAGSLHDIHLAAGGRHDFAGRPARLHDVVDLDRRTLRVVGRVLQVIEQAIVARPHDGRRYGRRAGQRGGRAAAIHVDPLAAVPALQRPGELVARRVGAGGHVEGHLAICVDRECRAGCRGVRAARGVDDLQRAVAARNRTAAARAGGGPAGHVAPTVIRTEVGKRGVRTTANRRIGRAAAARVVEHAQDIGVYARADADGIDLADVGQRFVAGQRLADGRRVRRAAGPAHDGLAHPVGRLVVGGVAIRQEERLVLVAIGGGVTAAALLVEPVHRSIEGGFVVRAAVGGKRVDGTQQRGQGVLREIVDADVHAAVRRKSDERDVDLAVVAGQLVGQDHQGVLHQLHARLLVGNSGGSVQAVAHTARGIHDQSNVVVLARLHSRDRAALVAQDDVVARTPAQRRVGARAAAGVFTSHHVVRVQHEVVGA